MAFIEVRNLVKHFPKRGGVLNRVVGKVHAVNGVSFDINEGETLGVVGESGCGKSTLGRAVLQLRQAVSGKVLFALRETVYRHLQRLSPAYFAATRA